MSSAWVVCSLLLLTMVAASRGRNAAAYFQEARFQHSPSRPEDALVLFIRNTPPIICEPDTGDECYLLDLEKGDFCLSLRHGFSPYMCIFVGNQSTHTKLELPEGIFEKRINFRIFNEEKMYCTTSSQLPEEYFHITVQRPLDYHPVKCHLLNDRGTFYLRFPGYPTITCYIGTGEGRYHFKLPGIDDPFTCAFRVYSELPLGDTSDEQRLSQSLISGLPARVDGLRPRVVCSRQGDSNVTALFELQLHNGATYDCYFPGPGARCLAQSQNTRQD